MALTLAQIQANITNKMDARLIINQIADYLEANPGGGSGGGVESVPIELTDDVTSVVNTLDESWGSVLNVTEDADNWFIAFRLGNFDASHWNGGFDESALTPGIELSYSDEAVRGDETAFTWMRFFKNTLLIEVGDQGLGNVGDFQITGGAFPGTYVAALGDDLGGIAAQQMNNINAGVPKSTLNSYDNNNESELYVTPEKVLATYAEKAGDPDATDIPAGYYGVYKHTGTSAVKLWVNDGGVFKSVALA